MCEIRNPRCYSLSRSRFLFLFIFLNSRDSDLSTIISNLHHTRQHGMPEGQPCSDISLTSTHSGKTHLELKILWVQSLTMGSSVSVSLFSEKV